MKETVNVSIASQAFTLDKDAYEVLSTYLKEVREHISADDNETMADVESRLAELFREKKPSAIMVISLSDVRAAMHNSARRKTSARRSARLTIATQRNKARRNTVL